MKRKLAIMVWPFAFTITLNAQWTGTTNIYNTNSGNVGIGTSTPINKLQVIGDISASTSLSATNNGVAINCCKKQKSLRCILFSRTNS